MYFLINSLIFIFQTTRLAWTSWVFYENTQHLVRSPSRGRIEVEYVYFEFLAIEYLTCNSEESITKFDVDL